MNICSTYGSNYRDRQIRRSRGKPRRCWPRKKSRTSYRPKKSRPPQLVASFIPSQACNVGFWHVADKRTQPSNGRYWVESRCGAVAVGRTYLLPPLSSGGALLVRHDSVSTSLSLIHISEPTRLGMISYA